MGYSLFHTPKLVIITLDVPEARQLIEILRSKICLEHSTQRSGVTLRCKAFSVKEINHPQDAFTVTLRLTLLEVVKGLLRSEALFKNFAIVVIWELPSSCLTYLFILRGDRRLFLGRKVDNRESRWSCKPGFF